MSATERNRVYAASRGISLQARSLASSLLGMRPDDLIHVEAQLASEQSRFRLIKMSAKRWAITETVSSDSAFMRDQEGDVTRRVQWGIADFVKGARSLTFDRACVEIARLRRMEDEGSL